MAEQGFVAHPNAAIDRIRVTHRPSPYGWNVIVAIEAQNMTTNVFLTEAEARLLCDDLGDALVSAAA